MNCFSDGWEDGWGVKVEMETLAMNCNVYGLWESGSEGNVGIDKVAKSNAVLSGFRAKVSISTFTSHPTTQNA